jgi:hypothetical protein
MKISISPKANPNYLAKVVKLTNLRPHPNADRLQITTIDGNNAITGLNAQVGDLYVYFPLESTINKDFLSWSNSFEDNSLNRDKKVKGFFNNKGRVRAIKLRSQPSEGYIVPVASLEEWVSKTYDKFAFDLNDVGKEFDTIGDIKICEKYVSVTQRQKSEKVNKNQKKVVREPKPAENQFRYHVDTIQLKKAIHDVSPDGYISITKKLHGTSWVAAKLLCNKRLSWFEKLLKRLGVKIQDTHYDLLWASRRVLKNGFLESEDKKDHFYSYDLWEDIAKSAEVAIQDSITLYGEAVGYTKTGGYIQDKYDYGCKPGTFKTFIYRITTTTPSGQVYEFSHNQVKEYCDRYGLTMVPELYYGKAKDLYPEIPTDAHWHQNFLDKLMENYLEKDCNICSNKVPDEGICLRRDIFDIDVYKLKSFKFFEYETKQLDKGVVDMETEESVEE